MRADLNRRSFLASLGALTAAGAAWRPLDQPRPGTRLILLGTGGGPRPRPERMASAHVVIANGRLYVVDCGNGVARQLASAGASLPTLAHVFITHHHSDHNADYGNLLLLAWAAGLQHRVDTYGPPPIDRITKLFLEMSATDIETRIADEGRVPLVPLIHVHELTRPGLVMQDDAVKVTFAVVEHPMIKNALAYRFDATDRSIVFSGDTARSTNLLNLAKGADVLVHEAMYLPAIDRLVARTANASTLKQHLVASHTAVEDCARIAADAGVKTLVLSHLVPADDPLVTEAMWIEAARPHFSGQIIVARDLMEV